MSRKVLQDIQIFIPNRGMSRDEQKRVNQNAFASFEPVRLWAKEQQLVAPFKKLVVTLADPRTADAMGDAAPIVDELCNVILSTELETVRDRSADHRWMLARIVEALDRVSSGTKWDCTSLREHIALLQTREWPLRHYFESRAQSDSTTGMRCVPWFETRPMETRVGVRLGDDDVVVLSETGPLYLEDKFPMARTTVVNRDFLILDRAGETLARVLLPPPT